jgi:hypothetical protein
MCNCITFRLHKFSLLYFVPRLINEPCDKRYLINHLQSPTKSSAFKVHRKKPIKKVGLAMKIWAADLENKNCYCRHCPLLNKLLKTPPFPDVLEPGGVWYRCHKVTVTVGSDNVYVKSFIH